MGEVYKLFDGVSVIVGANLYSDAIPLGERMNMNIWYKAKSETGSPKVQMFYEMALTNFTGPQLLLDMDAVLLGGVSAFNVQYTGAQASATIRIKDDGTIELCAPALTVVQTISPIDYFTITDVIAKIDGLTDWTCTIVDATGDELSLTLKEMAATACKVSAVACTMSRGNARSLDLSPVPYLRLKAVGLPGTPADTLVWAYVFVQ